MKALRLILIGLAVIIFAGFGWRIAGMPGWRVVDRRPPPTIVAEVPPAPPVPAPPAPVPAVPAPAVPAPAPSPLPVPAAPPPSQAAEAPPPPAAGLTAQEARRQIDAILTSAPDLAQTFALLKAQFPVPAEHSMAIATEALRTTGVVPSPDDLFAGAMRELRQSSGVLAAKAGPDALSGIFDVKATTLADLEQADPRICADYLFGGTSPEYADFEAGHRALVARGALANIQAMADGRIRQKDWGAPSTEDFKWIEDALAAKGLSADEIGVLLDGKSPDPSLTDARLCHNARTYLDVLRAMPADARNRVYGLAAELLARS